MPQATSNLGQEAGLEKERARARARARLGRSDKGTPPNQIPHADIYWERRYVFGAVPIKLGFMSSRSFQIGQNVRHRGPTAHTPVQVHLALLV